MVKKNKKLNDRIHQKLKKKTFCEEHMTDPQIRIMTQMFWKLITSMEYSLETFG